MSSWLSLSVLTPWALSSRSAASRAAATWVRWALGARGATQEACRAVRRALASETEGQEEVRSGWASCHHVRADSRSLPPSSGSVRPTC